MSATERARISTSTVLFIMGAAFLAYRLQFILLPFVISGLLAYICNPLIDRLTSRTRLNRWFFAVATFVMLVLIALLIGLLALPPLLYELRRTVTDLQGTLTGFARAAIGDGNVNVLGRTMNASELSQAAASAARDWIGQPERVFQFGEIAFSAFFGSLLSLVLLFYFLHSGPELMRRLLWLVPPARRSVTFDIWTTLDPVLRRYFLGVLAVVTYAATAAYIGLGVVLHLPHAVFLALLTGFLEMIPVLGPSASAVLAGIVAIHHATSIQAITAYAVYATVLRLSIDQLLGPLVLGAAAQMHPAAIIFCFIVGGVLFGIAGFILAVPAALIVRTCLAVLYGETSARNQTSTE